MTDAPGTTGGVTDDPRLLPPYPVDLVADLHAGVLDDDLADALWPRAVADPGAAAVLAALDRTRVDLQDLGEHPAPVAAPPEVTARLEAALAALGPVRDAPPPAPPRESAPVLDLAAARRHRGRLAGAGVVGLAAAAAAVVVLTGTSGVGGDTGGTALPADTAGVLDPVDPPVELTRDSLAGGAVAALGSEDLGDLPADALAGCLAANEVPAGTEVLGSSPVVLDGVAGTLLLLPTGTAGRITALVVGPGCSADEPAQLARQDLGTR